MSLDASETPYGDDFAPMEIGEKVHVTKGESELYIDVGGDHFEQEGEQSTNLTTPLSETKRLPEFESR